MAPRLFLSSGDLVADRRYEFARDLQLKGDLPAAAELLEQAIELVPKFPSAWYTLGGLDVDVAGNRATLVEGGALAGSVTNLLECMKVAVRKVGLPLETAVACVTMNPAKALGEYESYGSITPGKKGNVVLLDKSLDLKLVVKDGAIWAK